MSVDAIKTQVAPIAQKHRVSFLGLFGSRARGTARQDSDYDFIARFEKTPSLVELIRFEHELEEALHAPVDVVIEGSEKPFVKESIKHDLLPIYG